MKKIICTAAALLFIASADSSAKDLNKAEGIINSILSSDKDRNQAQPGDNSADKKSAKKKGDAKKTGKETEDKGAERAAHKNAVELFNAGMYDEALEAASAFSAAYPQSRLIDMNRILTGRILLKKFEHEKAAAEFSQIKEGAGEYPAAVFYSAETERLKGNRAAASAGYLKAAAVNPGGDFAPQALLHAARIQLDMKNGDAAVETTVRLIKTYPDRDTIDDAYFLLAKIYETDDRIRDIETARSIYRIFIKKADAGEQWFKNSPLKKRAAADLSYIEKKHFRMD